MFIVVMLLLLMIVFPPLIIPVFIGLLMLGRYIDKEADKMLEERELAAREGRTTSNIIAQPKKKEPNTIIVEILKEEGFR